MKSPREPMFLARQTYRRRRLMDAARLLPFIGAFAFAVPVLWNEGAETSSGVIYLFVAWMVLILLAAWLSQKLDLDPDDEDEERN